MSLVGISAGKYSQQGKCLRGWHSFSITGQRLIFLVLPYFYNLPGLKFFVCFLHAFAKFKPAPLELEKSCPLPPRTLLTRIRPADHPNPCPARTSVPIPHLSEQTTKNSSPLKTCLTSSKIKLIIPFTGNQNFSTHLIYRRFEVIKTTFQSSCDQVCVKHCLIHLEGLLDWIISHQVRR